MSKNIEINIQTASNTYEILYPKTLGSLIEGTVSNATNAVNATNANTATTANNLASTLEISKGGTSGTDSSSAIYNLLNSLTPRSSNAIDSYASSTYLACYYGSSGYKVPISNLLTYIENNANIQAPNMITTGNYTGTGNASLTITPPSELGSLIGISISSKAQNNSMEIIIKGASYISFWETNFYPTISFSKTYVRFSDLSGNTPNSSMYAVNAKGSIYYYLAFWG